MTEEVQETGANAGLIGDRSFIGFYSNSGINGRF